ncbi:MAG: 23S rRNA (pseudouridine(1915)-N(3))-methyltransferase RlmH [Muribaculaceae bacterium]
MKITLVVIGKTGDSYLSEGINNYVKRLSFYIPFEIQYLADLKSTKNLSEIQQKQFEGQVLLKFFDPSDYVVLLDEHGKEFTSIDFSKYIEKKMHSVSKRLIFVIGGPYGFSQEVKAIANEKISISKMTFSHEMIRLIFTEQLYRAMTILNNEPYHHE